jgi:hypothetical protein
MGWEGSYIPSARPGFPFFSYDGFRGWSGTCMIRTRQEKSRFSFSLFVLGSSGHEQFLGFFSSCHRQTVLMNFLEGLFLLPRLSSCHNSVGAWKLRWRAGPLLLVIFSCRNSQVYAEMLSYASCCFLSFFLFSVSHGLYRLSWTG